MSPHDQALVDQANAISNPIDWYLVPDEELAESKEAREILHRRRTYLYHREEGNDI
ncbi:MAG: hypothetical protein IJQ06_00770 [Paludibacteraceae bacterium]|nr:hypothetical protein [Paludibacteraceae bacterium]